MFKISPTLSVKVWSSAPKGKKAVLCLIEKIHVLKNLHLGMSYRVQCERITIYIK